LEIRSLSFVVVEATDLDAWRAFACDVLGLMPNEALSNENALYLRTDDHPFRLVVERSAREGLGSLGWQVAGPDAFTAALRELEKEGLELTLASDAECSARCVKGLVRFEDISGARHEIHHGIVLDHVPFQSPAGVSGFVTGEQGFGHVVLPAPDFPALYDFYTRVLGFRLSDSMQLGPISLHFLHCNGRHHSAALLGAPNPAGIFHFMLEAQSLDDVGYALDRVAEAGAKVTATLGKHTNDQMVSFYVRSPSGFDVEFGTGGLTVDDATWTTAEITRTSFWGHKGLA
jgi:3,4-dihydroxy-9,10-secoandrosta-1,3,5(10)-triene-9,17-dione 4,5-dioxygenase